MKNYKVDYEDWSFYVNWKNYEKLSKDRCGKWIFCFAGTKENISFIKAICEFAVENNISIMVKHTREYISLLQGYGMCCFYCNDDDTEIHRKILSYLIKNNLIFRRKNGYLYNIPFKYEEQSDNNEYGRDFVALLSINDFIDLETEKWRE